MIELFLGVDLLTRPFVTAEIYRQYQSDASGVDRHTVQSIFRALGLARCRRRCFGAARGADESTLAAIDFGLELSRVLLELAEAILQSVVGCAEVGSCVAEVELVDVSLMSLTGVSRGCFERIVP